MQTCSGMSIGRLLERVPVADDVDERQQDVEARRRACRCTCRGARRRRRSAAAPRRRSRDDDDDQHREHDDDDQRIGHALPPCRPTRAARARASARRPARRGSAAPRASLALSALRARPRRAAQLRLADAPGGQLLERDRDLADERVDGGRFALSRGDTAQERPAEAEQRDDRERREEEPLHPARAGRAEPTRPPTTSAASPKKNTKKPPGVSISTARSRSPSTSHSHQDIALGV